jgi:hypothetical protein
LASSRRNDQHSVKGGRKLAVPEKDRRLVIIVTDLGIAVDENATTPYLLNASLSAVRRAPLADLQAIGVSAFRFPPLAARGYPKSGFLNKLQHKALLIEVVTQADTSADSGDHHPSRRHSGGGGRNYSGGGGGPGGLFGGMMGGLFGRR